MRTITFDHEKLDVYRVSLDFVAFAYTLAVRLKGPHRHAKDQLLRASQSIPQNIAEGNGKRSLLDRARFLDIARGSGLECAAILDVLHILKAVSVEEVQNGKEILYRTVSMLSKLIGRSESVSEAEELYGNPE